ncbi:RNA polymerase sigma factor [Steroidobacter sp.]|uniref:RNA polymerase sigma factor n=1 Tax=Steroidobacter sp. TaxID=1978227 RepID=UPI001A584F8B|nr:sigma-70 family RNA polymerase sigma factor [Steroidobacter sp.]MBL8270643.1 sigma-70 family RNA polymerase sigma factor [Steroidobacter sp.]
MLSGVNDPLRPNQPLAAAAPGAPDSQDELLAHLNRRFRLPLLKYFGRRVRSAHEAEDLTQDVFERVLRSRENRPIENAEAFVFRVAVNLLRDRARRAQSHGTEEALPAEVVAEFVDVLTVDLSPERVVLGERTLQEALSVLDELGERTRAMFYLYRFEGLKVREIAEMYGISASGVEKQLEKALLHLTRRLCKS